MTFDEACDFLFKLPSWSQNSAYHPGLDRVEALLEHVGNPHLRYPVVHVAGTNGKGSVSAMVAAMYTASGHRVGLHTSPHLFSFAERMRVNGEDASEDWISDATERLTQTIIEVNASFFEASTALALLYFADEDVDLAVVEVGMGGRLDATNIVMPVVAVITGVGFDHTEHLGATLPLIAAEKAGILKPGVAVVSGCRGDDVKAVIRAAAALHDAELVEIDDLDDPFQLEEIEMEFKGAHQIRNAKVAIAAATKLTERLPELVPDVRLGLAETRRLSGLRGRSEIVQRSPAIVVDVAHNVEGIKATLEFMRDEGLIRDPFYVLMGLSASKNVDGVLAELAVYDPILVPAEVASPRLIQATELAERARMAGLRILEIVEPESFIKRFRETSDREASLLATGSHFLVGALPRALFSPGSERR